MLNNAPIVPGGNRQVVHVYELAPQRRSPACVFSINTHHERLDGSAVLYSAESADNSITLMDVDRVFALPSPIPVRVLGQCCRVRSTGNGAGLDSLHRSKKAVAGGGYCLDGHIDQKRSRHTIPRSSIDDEYCKALHMSKKFVTEDRDSCHTLAPIHAP